jgi:hypothetical protein
MDAGARTALLRRIQREAQAYANADETTRLIRWGRVMGLLEAGVVLGFWSAKARDRASEQVHYKYALHRLPRTRSLGTIALAIRRCVDISS